MHRRLVGGDLFQHVEQVAGALQFPPVAHQVGQEHDGGRVGNASGQQVAEELVRLVAPAAVAQPLRFRHGPLQLGVVRLDRCLLQDDARGTPLVDDGDRLPRGEDAGLGQGLGRPRFQAHRHGASGQQALAQVQTPGAGRIDQGIHQRRRTLRLAHKEVRQHADPHSAPGRQFPGGRRILLLRVPFIARVVLQDEGRHQSPLRQVGHLGVGRHEPIPLRIRDAPPVLGRLDVLAQVEGGHAGTEGAQGEVPAGPAPVQVQQQTVLAQATGSLFDDQGVLDPRRRRHGLGRPGVEVANGRQQQAVSGLPLALGGLGQACQGAGKGRRLGAAKEGREDAQGAGVVARQVAAERPVVQCRRNRRDPGGVAEAPLRLFPASGIQVGPSLVDEVLRSL